MIPIGIGSSHVPAVTRVVDGGACQHGPVADDPDRDPVAELTGLAERERERAQHARDRAQEEGVAIARRAADDRAVHELARDVNERAVALHEHAAAVFEEALRLRHVGPRTSPDGAARQPVR